MTKYYKILTADNKGEYSKYDFTKYLPVDGKPGKWLRKIENIEMCERGYHCFTPEHILEWLNVQLYEVEIKGRRVHGDNKTVAQQMRFIRKVDAWNDRSARAFSCWCAERVLSMFEKEYPNDKRPRETIETARRYADGLATDEELAAAEAAAWAAARDAARDAAWAAARYAAGDAARDAEEHAQTQYLLSELGISDEA